MKIGELGRGTRKVMMQLNKFGHLYIFNNSKPVAVMINMRKFKEIQKVVQAYLISQVEQDVDDDGQDIEHDDTVNW